MKFNIQSLTAERADLNDALSLLIIPFGDALMYLPGPLHLLILKHLDL